MLDHDADSTATADTMRTAMGTVGVLGRAAEPRPVDGPTGPTVLAGRYRLDRGIARGPAGEVWAATDEILGRAVAVKMLRSDLAADPETLRRFQAEAVSAARLVHPNIVETYDAGVDSGTAYIVMELVGGRSLHDLLAENGPLPPSRAVAIASQVAGALAEAHRQGVVHRGVRPTNVLIQADGRLKVADFGLGATISDTALEGPPSTWVDVAALGAVLYEMLCGAPPGLDPLPPRQVRAGIPKPLDSITMRALSPDPGLGLASAADLQSALLSIDLGPDDAVPMVVRDPTPPGGSPPIRFRQTERAWILPVGAIVAVAVVLVVVGLLFSTTETGQRLFNRSGGAGDGQSGPQPVTIRQAAVFDPSGDGDEHNDRAPAAFDRDPATTWNTHQYQGPQPFGGLKSGVGLVLTLSGTTAVRQVTLTTPTAGWTAELYVAEGPQPSLESSLESWGPPVASASRLAAGTTSLAVDGARGSSLLVWISDPGPANRVEITEIGVGS